MVESRTRNWKFAGSSLGPAGIIGGGSECTVLSSTLNTTTKVRPLSKAQNPQLLSGRHSINGCPLLRVGVHGVCVCVCLLLCVCTLNAEHKFQVWVTTILGRMSGDSLTQSPQRGTKVVS